MTIDEKIRDGKLRYDINREAEKGSALSSGRIDKFEYLTGGEMSSGEKDSLELSNQKEIFDELVNERRFEMNKLSEGIYLNNLTYHNKGKSAPKYFIRFKGPLII